MNAGIAAMIVYSFLRKCKSNWAVVNSSEFTSVLSERYT